MNQDFDWVLISGFLIELQYTLANPNRGVPILNICSDSEFVRISEVALILWRINNTKICGNPLLLVWSFNSLLNTLNI